MNLHAIVQSDTKVMKSYGIVQSATEMDGGVV